MSFPQSWKLSNLLLALGKVLPAVARASANEEICWLHRQSNFSLLLSEMPQPCQLLPILATWITVHTKYWCG